MLSFSLARSIPRSSLIIPDFLEFRALSTILGIETSCDDTGAGVVNDQRVILGEALASQTATSVK